MKKLIACLLLTSCTPALSTNCVETNVEVPILLAAFERGCQTVSAPAECSIGEKKTRCDVLFRRPQ